MATTEMNCLAGGGGSGYTKVGTVTIPNNTTDTVTLTFDEPITQFVAFCPNRNSTKYVVNITKYITMNRVIDGMGEFFYNWNSSTPAGDSDSGITLSADGKTLTLKQPRNYYSGNYIYFAWA